MARHLADILEMLAHLVAPHCQAAKPHVAFALRVGSAAALQVSYRLWLASCEVEPAPPPPTTRQHRAPIDPRINAAGGKA